LTALLGFAILTGSRAEVELGKLFKNEAHKGGWARFRVQGQTFELGGWKLFAGGEAATLTREGQGFVQFAPRTADYKGFIGVKKGSWGLLWDHSCLHAVDTPPADFHYWNKVGPFFQNDSVFAALSFYIHDKTREWLAHGPDYTADLTVKYWGRVKGVYIGFWSFLAASLNWRKLYAGAQLELGALWSRKRRHLALFLGWRPFDRKCHRNVEAWMLGLRYWFVEEG